MAGGTRPHGARLLALLAALALVVVLSLDWFALDTPHAPVATQEQDGSGILNLLNVYSVEGFHASGWAVSGGCPWCCCFSARSASSPASARGRGRCLRGAALRRRRRWRATT